ncbi:MAG: lysylphosphatidylglycerol synthase domain-containing protein [Humidesulfovibrio sp.]|uniref:lysylphosphatidylglycerol synthase domain-containing protein n=1 Tax=Humidesulfovibrio sp. TaxID=2910988 RepID=UPI0027FAD727|nr:lysylphosphatidylglycerol synthase domain-containing protein [Humidesulfovibrio sp.]MDQ7834808.1 lysylphosphatidylglycerol synthase domain-containing protein [Humidesulfovibrio sp.]
MTDRARSTLINLAKYGVVTAALGYLFWSGRLDLAHFRLREGGLVPLMWACLALVMQYLLSIFRYGVLLRAAVIRMPFAEVFRIGMIADFFNSVFFGGLGGDLVKVIYVVRAGGGKADSLACVLVDRLVGLVALLALSCAALLINAEQVLAAPGLRNMSLLVLGIFGGFVLCCIVGLVALTRTRKHGLVAWVALSAAALGVVWQAPGADSELLLDLVVGALSLALCAALAAPSLLPGRTLHRLASRLPQGDKLMALVDSVLLYRDHLMAVGAMFVFSLFLQLLILLSLYWLAQAIPLVNPPEFVHIFFAAPLAFLTSSLPLPGGGLGVGEFAFDQALRSCTANSMPVLGGAEIFLSWRVLGVILGLVGLPWYLRDTPKSSELREMATD